MCNAHKTTLVSHYPLKKETGTGFVKSNTDKIITKTFMVIKYIIFEHSLLFES